MSYTNNEIAEIKTAIGAVVEMIVRAREDSAARDQSLADMAKLTANKIGEQSDAIAEIRKVILRLDDRIKALENFVVFRRMLKPEEGKS